MQGKSADACPSPFGYPKPFLFMDALYDTATKNEGLNSHPNIKLILEL